MPSFPRMKDCCADRRSGRADYAPPAASTHPCIARCARAPSRLVLCHNPGAPPRKLRPDRIGLELILSSTSLRSLVAHERRAARQPHKPEDRTTNMKIELAHRKLAPPLLPGRIGTDWNQTRRISIRRAAAQSQSLSQAALTSNPLEVIGGKNPFGRNELSRVVTGSNGLSRVAAKKISSSS